MKFIVDSLPYYGEPCPHSWTLGGNCYSSDEYCPRKWSKEKVCSDENPHECEWLKEEQR